MPLIRLRLKLSPSLRRLLQMCDTEPMNEEVDHGRERVLEARREVAASGRWLGGKRPFGWERDPDPMTLLPVRVPLLDEDGNPLKGVLRLVPGEAEALRWAHRHVLDGGTLAGVAREWNRRGVFSPTRATGGPCAEVGRVLRRPRNAGLPGSHHRSRWLACGGR